MEIFAFEDSLKWPFKELQALFLPRNPELSAWETFMFNLHFSSNGRLPIIIQLSSIQFYLYGSKSQQQRWKTGQIILINQATNFQNV